jgi:hypothetical protein
VSVLSVDIEGRTRHLAQLELPECGLQQGKSKAAPVPGTPDRERRDIAEQRIARAVEPADAAPGWIRSVGREKPER